jgi:hypothetical protein
LALTIGKGPRWALESPGARATNALSVWVGLALAESDLGSRKPGRDRPVTAVVDRVQDSTAIAGHLMSDDQARLLEQAHLSRDGLRAELELTGKTRRSPGTHRQRGDDPAARRICKECNSGSGTVRHPPSMPGPDHLAIIRPASRA